MSRLRNKIFLTCCLLLFVTFCKAQNNPVYDQYQYNGLAINPAFAGSRDVMNLAVLYRTQWSKMPGSPVTQTLAGDFPMKNPQVALGLLLVNDKIGLYKQTGVYGDYAFRIKTRKGKLSLGLQAGFDYIREDETQLTVIESGDPMFNMEKHKLFMPNVGAGVYYYSSRYFAGISVPKLFYYAPSTADTYKGKPALRHIMLYGGMMFPVARNFKLKPSTLWRFGQEFLFDLNCNAVFLPNELLEIGVSYRSSNVWVAMAEIRINPQFCVGYSYDHAMGQANITNGSHEIMLRYEFRFRVNAENPLYLK